MADANVGATILALFCLGFFASRLPRRCFMDMGVLFSWRRGGENLRIVGPSVQSTRIFARSTIDDSLRQSLNMRDHRLRARGRDSFGRSGLAMRHGTLPDSEGGHEK